MDGFEDIGSKGHFSAKKGGFGVKTPLGGKRDFFSKIRLEHFFSLTKMQLCAKFQKNLMRGSPDIASRTDGRTDERESIGPSANAERPKTIIAVIFGPKWTIFATNGQILAISEFSRHIEHDFLKEDHKNNFHTKN